METNLADRKKLFRFSGHETFACRFSWLPKACRLVRSDPSGLADDERAMVALGVGKNMVKSLRFWVEAMDVAECGSERDFNLTPFGHSVFDLNGLDPHIEDPVTPWLLHWKLSTRKEGALFAWHFLLNQWMRSDFTRTEAIEAFGRESRRLGYNHSDVTLAQHLDVFLHTYAPPRRSLSVEDSLDGPLITLGLIHPAGERWGEGRRRETVFAFRRESRPEITRRLFTYVVDDYWNKRRAGEETLSLREIASGEAGPGHILKLTEDSVRQRVEEFNLFEDSPFEYVSSSVQGLVTRRRGRPQDLLANIYRTGAR